MKCLSLLAVSLALSGCAASQQAPATAACTLTVTFGSYAMGIDRPTFEAVDRLLATDRAVTRVDRRPWGREGEVTLCAATRSPADAERLFAEVKSQVPPRPRGPVTVETAAGSRYEVSNPN